MIKLRFLFLFLAFSPFLSAASSGQTGSHAPAVHRPLSDTSARKLFADTLVEYRNDPANVDVRDKLMEQARKLTPAPVIPSLLRQSFAEVAAQIAAASTPEERIAAADHMDELACQAPWWPEAWLRAAETHAKAGDLVNARRELALFLKTARTASDADGAERVQSEIDAQQAELDRRQAEAERRKAEEEHRKAEEARQQRQASFQREMAEFLAHPSDDARRQIIQQAAALDPKPAVPDEVHEMIGAAMYVIKNAASEADFVTAGDTFAKATDLAPWAPEYYFKEGVAYENAKRFDEALAAFGWYLVAAPESKDAIQVRERIGGLKLAKIRWQQEREREAAAAAEEQRKQQEHDAILEGLNGNWECDQGCHAATVTFSGSRFEIQFVNKLDEGEAYDSRGNLSRNAEWLLTGSRRDFALDGVAQAPRMYVYETRCDIPSERSALTGQISPDGRTIRIHTETSIYSTHAQTTGGLFSSTTCDSVRLDHKAPWT